VAQSGEEPADPGRVGADSSTMRLPGQRATSRSSAAGVVRTRPVATICPPASRAQ
jgi:hypothetical protein